MDSLEALIESSRNSPDELYMNAFLYFQALLRPLKADASKIQLPSHLPESVYSDRRVLGLVITAALVAMLDHRSNTGSSSTPDEILVLAHMEIMPTHIREQLDDIIIDQTGTLGVGICASELAHSRILELQHYDYGKFKRWLRALDRAARIYQKKTATPLTDPFLRMIKERGLEEVRPLIARLRKQFERKPAVRPGETHEQMHNRRAAEIVEAFRQEASNPNLPWLSESHNLSLWLDYCRSDPYAFVTLSPENLILGFMGWVTKHDPVYVGKQLSRISFKSL